MIHKDWTFQGIRYVGTGDLSSRNIDKPGLVATKQGMQHAIDAVQRAIDRKPISSDDCILIDVKHILLGLQRGLPE